MAGSMSSTTTCRARSSRCSTTRTGNYFEYVSPDHEVANLSRRFSGWSNGFFDYDNDGWKDIYSSNGDVDYFGFNPAQSDTLWQNRRQDLYRRFGRPGAIFSCRYQRGSAFADLNDDGSARISSIVTSLNRAPEDHAQLRQLRPVIGSSWTSPARASSRDAIGAKVKLTTGSGRRLLDSHVSVSVGFMSASDRRVHLRPRRQRKIDQEPLRSGGRQGRRSDPRERQGRTRS